MTVHLTIRRVAGRLRRDCSGLALLEFAFTLPLLLMAGMIGIETANLALVNLRISQIALNLADNASRVGNTPLATQQLREIDMNDVLQAARYQGSSINLTTQGRIIISSLENVAQTYSDHATDASTVQRIHWQRCLGLKGSLAADSAYNSSYGSATPLGVTGAGTDTTYANRGTDQATGMGDTGSKVNAPTNTGVVFVEVNYNYQPLITKYFTSLFQFGSASSTTRIHYVASFIVRDNRDFTRLFNPSPAITSDKMSTCDKYSA